jgi:hypothetical protein
LGVFPGHPGTGKVRQEQPVGVGAQNFDLAAQGTVYFQHYLNVFYVGDIAEYHGLVGKQRGGKAGKGGVFIAAGPDGPTDRMSAFY